MSSTDTGDESLQPRKRAKKNHLKLEEKNLIVKMYTNEMEENSTVPVDEIVKMVASTVGVCNSTVYKIVKEYKSTRQLTAPRTNRNRKSQVDILDDSIKNAIREKVHEFYFRNEFPNLDNVLNVVNATDHLPKFKRSTFYKLLKKLNFVHERSGRHSMLVDKGDIICWRRKYLKDIQTHRKENRKIYYIGETCINVNADDIDSAMSSKTPKQSTKQKKSSDKEKKLIVCHIGCEDGFVPDALWTFESKKPADFYREINAESFENWFKEILPKLESRAVIVLTNAPHHNRLVEKIPSLTSPKAEIQDWLASKNIHFDQDMVRVELLAIVKKHKNHYNDRVLDDIAEEDNKIIMRLPPYHNELNPIGLVWTEIKNYVATKNKTSEIIDVTSLLRLAIDKIGQDSWENSVKHVKDKVEIRLWQLDDIIDRYLDEGPDSDNNDKANSDSNSDFFNE